MSDSELNFTVIAWGGNALARHKQNAKIRSFQK